MVHDLVLTNQDDLPDGFYCGEQAMQHLLCLIFETLGMETKTAVIER